MINQTADDQRTRGYKKKERTRRQLIAAAIDVIAERGEAFSVSDVAKQAGVSNGTFYNYFEDREQLIDAVLPHVLTAFAAESAEAVRHDDPAVRFATITAIALHRAATDGDEIRAMLRLDAVQQAIIEGQALHHLHADLISGTAVGRFRTDIDGATLDIIIGTMLLAARRLADGDVGDDYPGRVILQLLVMLGLRHDEAQVIAASGVVAAADTVSR